MHGWLLELILRERAGRAWGLGGRGGRYRKRRERERVCVCVVGWSSRSSGDRLSVSSIHFRCGIGIGIEIGVDGVVLFVFVLGVYFF